MDELAALVIGPNGEPIARAVRRSTGIVNWVGVSCLGLGICEACFPETDGILLNDGFGDGTLRPDCCCNCIDGCDIGGAVGSCCIDCSCLTETRPLTG